MSQKRTNKSFDCLAFKERAQAEIYEEIQAMTASEERDYFRRKAESGPLGTWWKSLPETPRKDQ
jgi:hypothetical protein